MTSVSFDVYIDKLCDIVNKYNKAYPTKIKMKPIDAKSTTYIDFNKKLIKKVLNFRLVKKKNIKILKQFFRRSLSKLF